ncbi:MAG: hypothetical protein WC949_04930 [Candidatus Paceibacterota bacterium]|jgi:hypothetical protein
MKTNFEIIKGKDYQGDKCYRINFVEYDTLYTMPEPHYTKTAAKEKLRELKRENPITNAAATLGRIKSEKKAASSREYGKGGRPKLETVVVRNNIERWSWETNSLTAKLSPRGLILENWNCNQGAISGRKILIIGEKELPDDHNIQHYCDILKYGAADNIVVLRTGAIAR